MRPFAYASASDPDQAVRAFAGPDSSYLGGGTTLVDLMKLGIIEPEQVVDLSPIARSGREVVDERSDYIRLDAFATMASISEHPIIRSSYPVISQSLQLAASQQLRNMALVGGNVLQRTRCPYFRDVSFDRCNKRHPGSGCAAIGGIDRQSAVLGVSRHCVATYAGDFGQALIALDASVEILGRRGRRIIRFADLHVAPGETPHLETTLAQGELIQGFRVPRSRWARRSVYLKIRDRQSYAFALASAAVALDLREGVVQTARIGLGGVSARPWRAVEAEAQLAGKAIDEDTATKAAEAAFADAKAGHHNRFKIELGKQTLVRALLAASVLEIEQ